MKAKNLFPITITAEIRPCREFYQKFFGFEAVFESDWYIHLRHASGIELAFMLPDLQNQPEILHGSYAGNGVVLSFEVDDAAEEYSRIRELGADISYDLKDEEWGQRHFMVQDPAGMVLDIVQQL